MRLWIVSALSALVFGFGSNAFSATSEYTLDLDKSLVKWTGKKITGSSHWGHVKFKSGSLRWDGMKPVGGEFTVDLSSLTVEDIPKTDENNGKLSGHLKSDDFFNVTKFPTATYKIKSVTAKEKDMYTLAGDLTIKDKTHPFSFDAKITKKDGNMLQGEAKTTIDRTKYDVKYNSKAFFDVKKLGDNVILDEVELELNLAAGNPKAVNM